MQITDIVIVILCLFFNISKEFLGACWVTSLIVVLFVGGGVGIIETGKECEGWLGKIGMHLVSLVVFFTAGYFLYPMLQHILDSKPEVLLKMIFIVVVLIAFGIAGAQWGVALFFWIHFCYSAVFLHEGKVWFYRKMKKKEILAENIAEVKVALGNVAYAFYDENNNLLFEIQMKKENAGEFMKYMNERLCL